MKAHYLAIECLAWVAIQWNGHIKMNGCKNRTFIIMLVTLIAWLRCYTLQNVLDMLHKEKSGKSELIIMDIVMILVIIVSKYFPSIVQPSRYWKIFCTITQLRVHISGNWHDLTTCWLLNKSEIVFILLSAGFYKNYLEQFFFSLLFSSYFSHRYLYSAAHTLLMIIYLNM